MIVFCQAEMQSGVILAVIVDAAVLDSHLSNSARAQLDARTDSITVGLCTLEVDLEPMITISDVVI